MEGVPQPLLEDLPTVVESHLLNRMMLQQQTLAGRCRNLIGANLVVVFFPLRRDGHRIACAFCGDAASSRTHHGRLRGSKFHINMVCDERPLWFFPNSRFRGLKIAVIDIVLFL